MTQTINRMYESLDQARQAAHDLQTHRFIRFTEVHVVGPDAGGADASLDGIVQALMKAYVLKAHARVVAPAIQRGHALVTVHAPFGTATTAIWILDSHGPVDSGLVETQDRPVPWDEATPCSNVMGLPVLAKHDDSFSRFWSLPELTRAGGTTCATLGLPELLSSDGPYTGLLGMPLLSSKGTVLSSMLGLPVLMSNR
jgi:hypothetical protein